jgi:hypothetical protein
VTVLTGLSDGIDGLAGEALEDTGSISHFPNPFWHPIAQNALVLPLQVKLVYASVAARIQSLPPTVLRTTITKL